MNRVWIAHEGGWLRRSGSAMVRWLGVCLVLAGLLGSALTAQVSVAWVGAPRGVALAVDDRDHVYSVDYEAVLGAEMTVTKQDVLGAVIWVSSFDQTDPSRWERAAWMGIDPSGNVIVVGTSMSGFSNPVAAASIVMKFAPDGTLLWRQIYESTFDGSSVRRCVVDDQGRIYVLGLGPGPNGFVSKVKAFAPDGTTLWTYHDSDGIGAPIDLKLAQNGDLVLVGRSTVGNFNGYARIDDSGQRRFGLAGVASLTLGDAVSDASDRTHLVHADASGGSRIRCLDLNGTLIWDAVAPISAFRVAIGPDQSPVLCGFPNSGTPGAAFAKFSPTGTPLWVNANADGPLALLLHAQLLVDDSSDAYLAASTLFQMAVCKIHSDGTAAWTQTLTGSSAVSMARSRNDSSLFVVGGNMARLLDPEEGPWTDLGGGLAGPLGSPGLRGIGPLEPLSLLTLEIIGGPPSAPGVLIVGADVAAVPIAGGVLIPSPDLSVPILGTDASGAWSLTVTWPTGLPASLPFYLQAALVDPLAPAGLAGSNGLRGVTP